MMNTSNESQIILALQAYRSDARISLNEIARVYGVSRSTLQSRNKGRHSRRDIMPTLRKLTVNEEDIIVKRIIDLDARSFPPRLRHVEDMANILLRERGAGHVGVKWASNFIKRRLELKMRLNRRIDYQRARCEDPDTFRKWFDLVRNTINKYGIAEADIYNFDETGFMMGVFSAFMVVTRTDRVGRPRQTQQGNREWITVIQAVNSQGWTIPPYIIVAGKTHLASWYREYQLPGDWKIALTSNGWTTNEKGLEWVQHFDKHSRARSTGRYRLLILDGHESHHSMEFEEYCKKNDIITLCMPAHSSHRLQPLDVGCFSVLKRTYGHAIEDLIRQHVTHISKEDFFPAFHQAFIATFTPKNIQAGFRGTGLVPFDPDHVISQLDSAQMVRTPSPNLDLPLQPWVSQTPKTINEATSQTVYMRNRIQDHQGSSPTSILEGLDKAAKGTYRIMHENALLKAENARLQEANHILSKRRRTKNQHLSDGTTLSVYETEILQAGRQDDTIVVQGTVAKGGRQLRNRPTERRCGTCGKAGHNVRTCSIDVEISNEEDSD